MAAKLAKDTYPDQSSPGDFQCFGPPATRDGDFDTVKICDMGCFTQDGKDSNKYYHGADRAAPHVEEVVRLLRVGPHRRRPAELPVHRVRFGSGSAGRDGCPASFQE